MHEKATEHHAVESLWKRLIVRALAWGIGCGVGIATLLLAVYFYMQRPKDWDTSALRVKNVRAEGIDRLDEGLAQTSVGTFFSVDLENTTAADITLSQNLTIMQTTKGTEALHGSLLKLHKEYFVPAHHVVTIMLENDELCAAKVEPQTCFNNYFKDQSQIYIFDDIHKYEVRIPIPAFTAPEGENVPK